MGAKKTTAEANQDKETRVSFYPAWCKGCGNCVSFCPRKALAMDQWGHPYLSDPDRCTSCGLCEMLCPDFAISVGEAEAGEPASAAAARPGARRQQSPERLAPGSEVEDA